MISDVIDFGIVVPQPRSELWDLLATPQWYPRLFTGIGATARVFDPALERSQAYSVRAGYGRLTVSDIKFRVRENHAEYEFAIEGIEHSWFASVRLQEDSRTGGTRISAAIFKGGLVHPDLVALDNSAITEWLRAGISRAVEYLCGKPTARIENCGEGAAKQLNVGKTIVTAGVVDLAGSVLRFDRAVRQLGGLARWGFTMAGGYAAAQAYARHRTALIDDLGETSFGDIHRRSTQLAAGLYRLGVRAEDAVGILARNHTAMVEAMVGCGKLGAHALLMNTGLASLQIQEIAARQQLAAIFVDDEFNGLVRHLPRRTTRISTWSDSIFPDRLTIADLIADGEGANFPRPRHPGKQIVLTSGTSGTPKAAMRPEPKGFSTIAAMLSRLPLQTEERMLIAAPLFHSWGMGMQQLASAIRATVVLQARFDPESCLRAISEHRCTSLVVVPIMLQRMLDLPPAVRARYDTSCLRVIASCGSPLPGSLPLQVMDIFGDVLYNFYGSTEVSWATCADPADLRAAPATAGRPQLGTQVAILDDQGQTVPVGAIGRIFVGNEMLFDGYLNAAGPKVAENLMDTGDLGYLDADGRLFVSGRDDEMIISGGENVFPRPVEDALALLPQVQEVAVIGVPDQEYGQRLAAFVVPHSGAILDVEMLRHYIRNRLSRFSVPRDFTFLESLPRSATGKILKRVLAHSDLDLA